MYEAEFKNRVAVITGGSDGLGYDFCARLVDEGCRVYFCARNRERGEAAKKSLGPSAHFVQADLANPGEITRFADTVKAEAGSVDYLVNNIAIDDRIEFADVTAEACDRMYAVNLRSYVLTSRAFYPLLQAGEGKAVVNIGTTNYTLGLEPFTLYNATKSGIVGFTRSLARELGREGIRVNMLSPGWIMTRKQLEEHVSESDKADLIRDQALKFLLRPEHVTPPLLFLLSSQAAALTGQDLIVDNGKVMW